MKRISFILSILILVIALMGPLSSPLIVNATTYTSVNNISDPKIRNAFKIWSVAICAGMSEAEAAGMIANAEAESGIDGTKLESLYGEEYTIGPQHQQAFANLCNYAINTMFKGYRDRGWKIIGSTDAHGHKVESITPSNYPHSVTSSAYIGKTRTGSLDHFLPGMGMFQFTGETASRLMYFASDIRHTDWYDEDTQLVYIYRLTGEYLYGRADWILNKYIGNQYGNSPEYCADYFKWVFEMGKSDSTFNPNDQKCIDTGRETKAREWYTRFHNNNGINCDYSYGVRILNEAGFPIKYISDNRIKERSILHTYFCPVIEITLSNGFDFDIAGEADNYAKEASISLLRHMPEYTTTGHVQEGIDPVVDKKYSLYDLFGSDIHWYRYFGESTYPATLLDYVWSGVDQHKEDQLWGSAQSVLKTVFYTSETYLSCNVYKDRPTVLTTASVAEGKTDPRVSLLLLGHFNGLSYVKGSLFMEIAKKIVSLVSYFMGPEPIYQLKSVFDFITGNEIWGTVAVPLVMLIVAISMIFFIVSLVGKAKNFAIGKSSLRELLKRFIIGVLALSIIFIFAARPETLNNIVTKAATIVDEVFNSAMTASHFEDDVVGSSDGTNTIEAMLWRTAIFEPWCKGQFGYSYNELYTQYATDLADGQSKMPQSILNPDDLENLNEGEYLYNSAEYTGDVIVPVGNNRYIRNWAAFLYSCQSKYHIDYEYTSGKKSPPAEINFPNATTTAYDTRVYADIFRVIDAQMDISPQIYKDNIVYNYTGSHKIDTSFNTQGRLMIVYAIVLFAAFMPAIISKLKNLALLFFTLIQAIFYGIKELAKEGSGLNEIPEKIKTYAIGYFVAALRLYILVVLYDILVGKSIVQTIMFGFLTVAVYSLSVDNIRSSTHRITNGFKRTKEYIINKI